MNKYEGLKTIEDYKSYYEDTSREEILNDTYIDFVGYKNLAKEYSKLKEENERLKNNNNPLKGIFAGVNDDMLLRDLGNLSAENQSLKDRMKMINELLKQYTPTYASCVKLLDEIELFAKGDK